MIVHDLSLEAVLGMVQVDLATLDEEPDSTIGQFPFNNCLCGVAAFRGRPPWEHHPAGDELLLVLSGESELTVLEGEEETVQLLGSGQLAIVPQGCWHSNNAREGVTMLYLTPAQGNEHSWDDPRVLTVSHA